MRCNSHCTKIGDFIYKNLCEFEAEFRQALDRELGIQGELYMKKKKVKNLVTLSL
jgi:hypothetical protein